MEIHRKWKYLFAVPSLSVHALVSYISIQTEVAPVTPGYDLLSALTVQSRHPALRKCQVQVSLISYKCEFSVKVTELDDKETILVLATYRHNSYYLQSACAAICRHATTILYSTVM